LGEADHLSVGLYGIGHCAVRGVDHFASDPVEVPGSPPHE
jgi:hypothetical protein